MPDNVYQDNVYSLKKNMWHSKGRVGEFGESAKQVYSKMQPVVFEKRAFSVPLNGVVQESGDYAIIKLGAKEVVVGVTKDRYVIMQPMDYCEMFDTALPGMSVETCGFLGQKAEKMFITWVLPEIDIHGDKVELYGMLSAGFDGIYGEHLHITSVRTVCQNTFNASVSEAQETQNHGRGSLYSGKHNNPNHLKNLASWMTHIQKDAEERVEVTKNLFCSLDAIPVSNDMAYGLFSKIYPPVADVPAFYPDDLRQSKQESIDKRNKTSGENREQAMSLYEGAGIEIPHTAYGVFQAVTELENHHRPSKKDDTLSILFGKRNQIMTRALNIVTELVNKK